MRLKFSDRRITTSLFDQTAMRRHIHLLVTVILYACTPGSTSEGKLHAVLREQLEIHPALQVEDVYKLLYQGSLGIEHLLTDTIAAKHYLAEEWQEIPAGSNEPLVEIISPDSQWVRLNLKPFKAIGGNSEMVWGAMLRSSHVTAPREVFVQRWREFVSLVGDRRLPFDAPAASEFDTRMASEGYNATHHSSGYLETYEPAYRVLLLGEARGLVTALSAQNPF